MATFTVCSNVEGLHRRNSRIDHPARVAGRNAVGRLLVVACAVVAAWGASVQDASAAGSSAVLLTSAANQTFTVGLPSTAQSVPTVTDSDTATIKATTDLRIRIPAAFNMTFDTSVTTVTLGGTAAAKVSTTLMAYEDSDHTVVLNVTTNFANLDTLTVTGLKFTNFTAISAVDNLELVVAGPAGATKATDSRTITITAGASLSSAANQSFGVGDASTTTSVMTVTETASVTITAANDIRIRIPSTFSMTFDPTVTTVTLGGTASAKVSTTLSAYEDSNRTAVFNVTSNFTAGQTLTITGLKFTNFTAVSGADNLELVTGGGGGTTADEDDKTITIVAAVTLSSLENRGFGVGEAPSTASDMTVTHIAASSITAANDLRIRIPSTFNMTFDPTVTTVTLGGTASAKVSTTLMAYEDGNQTAVLNVTANFTAGQTLTIAGLTFTNFTAASAADNLELVTSGAGGTTRAWDDKTIAIVETGPFGFRKSITIDRTKCPGTCGTTLANFPMLYSVTDLDLRTTANGGDVTDPTGDDILFRALDDATCGGVGTAPCTLDHEIELYTATTGKLVAWVRIPSLNTNAAASNTVIYIYYGNDKITTSIQNAAGVWGTDFRGVWHLKEGTGVTAADSTSNANGAVPTGANPTTATGKIGNALTFNNVLARLVAPFDASLDLTSAVTPEWTMSAWAKPASYPGKWASIYGYGLRAGMNLSNDTAGADGRVENWTNDAKKITGVVAATLNAWNYVTVSRTATTTTLYLNGIADHSEATPEPVTGAPEETEIGNVGGILNEQFDGLIDEVRLSGVAQNACWTAAEYNNQNAPGDIGAPNFYTVGAETATTSVSLSAVELIAFTGTRYDPGVLLQWKTGNEIDNLGFNLYREVEGERTKVNGALIGGSGLMAGQGTQVRAELAYARWDLDPAATSADVVYFLEDLDFNGTRTLHGPITPVAGLLGAPAPTVAQSTDLADLGRRGKGRKVFRSHGGDREERRDGRRRKAPAQTALEMQRELAGQPAVKIGIRTPGWYRVSQADLVAAGLDPQADPRRLQLFVDGEEQALRVTAARAGRFAAGDAIEFYATGIDTPYTDTRVYWLVAGTQPGRRIGVTGTGAGGRPAGPASFSSTIRQKERSIYFAALTNGEQENWFGAFISTEPTDVMFAVDHIDRAAGAAQLEVTMQGVTSSLDGILQHVVGVLVNGTEVGELTFAGQLNVTQTLAVPTDVLVEGDNAVTLIARGGEEDYSLVDVLALTYGHTYQADADRLRASVAVAGPLTIGGFASSAIRVVDITDPSAAAELRGAVRTEAGGLSAVTVSVQGPGPRTLLAFSDLTVATPAFLQANRPSTWHAATQARDWVAISHGRFVEPVEPLAALRSRQGHRAAVVDVEDVYDEFSFGEKTPQALKDFLQSARTTWRTAPRFVVLVGDATTDPRDYAGEGNADFVPSKHVPMTTVSLETASDDWFVDFDNDGLPDLAIGRLPVRTAEHAEGIVAKIVNYDESDAPVWTKQVLLVADEDGGGSTFEQDTLKLQSLLPSDYTARTLFRGELGAGATHQAVQNGVQQGQLIVNYVGHGSVQIWGDVLTSDDVWASWRNGSRLPFVVAMNCLNGFFTQVWGEESLAEALLRAPDGGGVAVWASSSITSSATQALVNQELFRQIFGGSHAALGDAITAAKRVVSSPDVRRSWIFFGDPAMALKGVPSNRATPSTTLAVAPLASEPTRASRSTGASSADAASTDAASSSRDAVVHSRLADFDGDGRDDLFFYVAETGVWTVQLSGALPMASGQWPAQMDAFAARLNADRFADVVLYNRETGEWLQAIGTGAGDFTTRQGVWAPNWLVDLADFTGDRLDDVLLHDRDTGASVVCVTRGEGDFTCQAGAALPVGRVEAADYTRDGYADLFVYDAATGLSAMGVNDGHGRFAYTMGTWFPGWTVSTGDLDGDRRDDVVLVDPAAGDWVVAMTGARGAARAPDGRWTVTVVDLNGDGLGDFWRYDALTGHWTSALQVTPGRFVSHAEGRWQPGATVVSGDRNGDGRADLLLYVPETGAWLSLVGTGTTAGFESESGIWTAGATVVGR